MSEDCRNDADWDAPDYEEFMDELRKMTNKVEYWKEENPKWILSDCPFDIGYYDGPCEEKEVDDTSVTKMTIAPTRFHWLSLKLLQFALWLGAYVGVGDEPLYLWDDETGERVEYDK